MLTVLDLDEVFTLIQRKKYFVLHAPPQTGKTSTLLELRDHLNASGRYRCVYANFEVGQTAREDVPRAMRALLTQLGRRAIRALGDDYIARAKTGLLAECGPDSVFNEALAVWSERGEKPLVLLIDEIDSLEGDTLISVLRQLRAGYDERPGGFPQSVILCGVRDVRDFQIYSSTEGTDVHGGSAFNIKAESLRLGDFSEGDVGSLLGQHTAEMGQRFSGGAAGRVWELTRGQPWLVNALAYQACFKDKKGRDRSRPISLDAIDRAKETLILEKVAHLDQLADKLREDRVRRVIMPMLAGSGDWDYTMRDLEYVRDLGLVALGGVVRIANPIYAEVIPRELTASLQSGLESKVDPEWYVNENGSLNVSGLVSAFQC